ncbi:MAG: lytic transglycosylase [Desulfobacterales bacterium]|nr:MAG: lytic transglycosylase [Desulfobacterales bacterium]
MDIVISDSTGKDTVRPGNSRKNRTPGVSGTNLVRLVFLASLFFLPAAASGDIYKYVDEHGVVHFTNVPTSSRYSLFIPSVPRMGGFMDVNKYDYQIALAARMYKLPFSLIKAVIATESAFNPRAVSRKGARGLMQLMPETAKRLNVYDSFNPMQNIMGGSRYLKMMLDRFKGQTPLALAGYNAGPNAVEKYNGIPPYKETQGYVKKVLAAYRHLKNKNLRQNKDDTEK